MTLVKMDVTHHPTPHRFIIKMPQLPPLFALSRARFFPRFFALALPNTSKSMSTSLPSILEEHVGRPPGFKTICCAPPYEYTGPLKILYSKQIVASGGGGFERPAMVYFTELSTLLRGSTRNTMFGLASVYHVVSQHT